MYRLDDDSLLKLKNAYESGKAITELAEDFGVSVEYATKYLRSVTVIRDGFAKKFKPEKVTPAMIRRAKSDLQDGMHLTVIAKRCGVSVKTLSDIIKKSTEGSNNG